MTPKERWLAVLKGEKPDRLPMDYWATPEASNKLMKHLGCAKIEEVFVRLNIDAPVVVKPLYAGPPIPPDGDMYGCRYKVVNYGEGTYRECVHHPLGGFETVEEIQANYTWPTADWFDYSTIADQVKARENYPVQGGGSEPFLTYKKMRGEEQAFMDLILNPEIVHYCLDQLFGLRHENTCRIYEQIPGQVTVTYVAEDMGSQEGLMFSKEHIREFLLPRMKRIIDLVHEAGAYVFFHSDGAIQEILPDMIELGIDVLNPLQWRCKNMEREMLAERFGKDVVLHGGVDNQQTLPFGSVDDVKQEVEDNIRILGSHGRYILAPCHNIQSVSPPENIVALYEKGYELGQNQ